MLRRIAPAASRAVTGPSVSSRAYFYIGGGEAGIWASTMKKLSVNIWIFTFIGSAAMYKCVFLDRSTHRQFLGDVTDLWDSDGTPAGEGEEEFANIKLYRERIMPFMDALQEKIESA